MPAVEDPHQLSTEAQEVCGCCHRLKKCRMYVLQDLTTAWVCLQCRSGRE